VLLMSWFEETFGSFDDSKVGVWYCIDEARVSVGAVVCSNTERICMAIVTLNKLA